jgi:hypothetical protein
MMVSKDGNLKFRFLILNNNFKISNCNLKYIKINQNTKYCVKINKNIKKIQKNS